MDYPQVQYAGIWGPLVVWGVSTLASYLLRKYAFNDEATPLKPPDFTFPQTREGQPVNVVYGKVRVRNPTVLSIDNFSEVEHYGDVNGEDQFIAWRYYYDLDLGFCLGDGTNEVTFHKGWVGEKQIWSGPSSGYPAHASGTDVYDIAAGVGGIQTSLGGDGKGGSMSGDVAIFPGTFTQALTSKTPYRGLAHMLFLGTGTTGYLFGERPSPPPISWEVSLYPTGLSSGVEQIGDDANPAEVLYDILTNEWTGLGIDASLIDTSSFSTAATTLDSESNGISVLMTSGEDASAVIGRILQQINAVLYEDTSTGTVKIKLIREDYTIGNLTVLDESNVSKVENYSQTSWQETYNAVRVVYPDRAFNYTERAAFVNDMANWTMQDERNRVAEFEFPYCTTATLANNLANRELLTLSTPIIKARLVVNRDAFSLKPGDAFVFNWSEYGVSNVVMRVLRHSLGTRGDNRIVVDAAQDVFSVDKVVFDPPTTLPTGPSIVEPVVVDDSLVTEQPWWYGSTLFTRRAIEDAEDAHLMTFAKAATANELTFRTTISTDGGTTYGRDGDRSKQFVTSAEVETAYDRTSGPYDTTVGLRIENLSDATVLATATATEIRAGANQLLLVNASGEEEWVAYESYTSLGGGVYRLNNVWRGLLDTAPHTHGVGSRVWFAHEVIDSKMSVVSRTRFVDDTATLLVRPLTENSTYIIPESSVTDSTVTLSKRAQAPYPPADFQVDGAQDYPGDTVYDSDGGSDDEWHADSEFATATWKSRIRNAEIKRGDDAAETISGSVDDGTTYDIQAQADGAGSWTDLITGISANSASADDGSPTAFDLRQFGSGLHHVRVRAKRTISSSTVYSYQAPEISFRLASYRQLLLNPGFEDDGRAWSVTGGTGSYSSINAYKGTGKRATITGSSDDYFEQTVDVSALSPVGKTAKLRFYCRSLNSGAEECTGTIEALDASDSSLGTSSSAAIVPGTGSWTVTDLSYSSLPASTAKLKIRLRLRDPAGSGNTNIAVDDIDLRLAKAISAEQLTEPGFNSGGTSWSTTNMGSTGASVTREGADAIQGSSSGAFSASQTTASLPAPIVAGDIAHMRFEIIGAGGAGEIEMILEALDNVGTVLDSVTTGTYTGVSGEVSRNFYMVIPTNTDKMRFRIVGNTLGNPTGRGIDDASLRYYDIT